MRYDLRSGLGTRLELFKWYHENFGSLYVRNTNDYTLIFSLSQILNFQTLMIDLMHLFTCKMELNRNPSTAAILSGKKALVSRALCELTLSTWHTGEQGTLRAHIVNVAHR